MIKKPITNEYRLVDAETVGEGAKLLFKRSESRLRPANEVHLVDRDHDLAHPSIETIRA
jgi:hypothetical protein